MRHEQNTNDPEFKRLERKLFDLADENAGLLRKLEEGIDTAHWNNISVLRFLIEQQEDLKTKLARI